MEDIELVIKIPEEKYNTIKSDLYNTLPAEMKEWGLEAIRNGIPLPKGHGELIDRNEISIPYDICDGDEAMGYISEISAIVEADKGDLEKINEEQYSLRAACKAWERKIEKLIRGEFANEDSN